MVLSNCIRKQALQCLLLAVLSWTFVGTFGQLNPTNSNDTQALSDLRDAIQSTGSYMAPVQNWVPDTDPCQAKWSGIVCSCTDLQPESMLTCNPNAYANATTSRVLAIDLSRASQKGLQLQGNLPSSLGLLTALLKLDLTGNSFSGALPDSIGNLTALQLLLLGGNKLTGPLPSSLGRLPQLQVAMLIDNSLSGAVPPDWCGNSATYYISGNGGLCGPLPSCLNTRNQVVDVSGTYVIRSFNDSSSGGLCDLTPPFCRQPSCQIMVPQYWTSTRSISFSFTDFQDATSGISKYQWGLGLTPGAADVLRAFDFTGNVTIKELALEAGGKPVATRVYQQNSTLDVYGRQLLNGVAYYVTVIAYNNAGPRLAANASSLLPVIVDATPPVASKVYNTPYFTYATESRSRTSLGVSWLNFTDLETNVTGYTVQFLVANGNARDKFTTTVDVGLANSYTLRNLHLQERTSYIARVTATNGAGLTRTAESVPVMIVPDLPSDAFARLPIILALTFSIVGALVLGSLVALIIMYTRLHRQAQKERERQQEQRQMKAMMAALTSPSSTTHKSKKSDVLKNAVEFAFVITDIESSTELSQAHPRVFGQMQDIHDQVMREGISKFDGDEIVTEGDSFSIAFGSVANAVQFCIDTQYRLLEVAWPTAALKLHACRTLTSSTGELLFRGPRVRMGVHWATARTVVSKYNSLTKSHVFSGPGYQIAQEVGEAAHGGQILLTHDAWVMLRENMPAAGFPVVYQIGKFQMAAIQQACWLYQIVEAIGKPLPRSFPPPRKVDMIVAGSGLHIMPRPEPGPKTDNLTFVGLRLTSLSTNRTQMVPSVASKMWEIIAMQAQQFKGYLYQTLKLEGRYVLVFQQTMDAMRFCHATQMLLMYTRWPPEAGEASGPAMPSPDGRWLFKGPRVSMAIHESSEYTYQVMPFGADKENPPVEFSGPAHELVSKLAFVVRGGQVVMSESAWRSIKSYLSQHPTTAQVCSLGVHIVDNTTGPMLLTEVMPSLLARRVFKPPNSLHQLEPGFRDAPGQNEPMTIVFVKVDKPEHVVNAERSTEEQMTQREVINAITTFQVAVQQYSEVARQLLLPHNGYECKEPEPGKFTLVFRKVDDAIRWCSAVQLNLLRTQDWPRRLLRMEGCRQCKDEQGTVVWGGLKVRMGMAYGFVSSKKPLATGRADYFGALPNTAARVCALAAPGQILVEGTGVGVHEVASWLRDDSVAYIRPEAGTVEAPRVVPMLATALKPSRLGAPEGCIETRILGHFMLRGLDQPKVLFQATPPSLAGRQFPMDSSALVEPQHSSKSTRHGSVTSLQTMSPASSAKKWSMNDLFGRSPARRRSLLWGPRYSPGGDTPRRHRNSTGSTAMRSISGTELLGQDRPADPDKLARSRLYSSMAEYNPSFGMVSNSEPSMAQSTHSHNSNPNPMLEVLERMGQSRKPIRRCTVAEYIADHERRRAAGLPSESETDDDYASDQDSPIASPRSQQFCRTLSGLSMRSGGSFTAQRSAGSGTAAQRSALSGSMLQHPASPRAVQPSGPSGSGLLSGASGSLPVSSSTGSLLRALSSNRLQWHLPEGKDGPRWGGPETHASSSSSGMSHMGQQRRWPSGSLPEAELSAQNLLFGELQREVSLKQSEPGCPDFDARPSLAQLDGAVHSFTIARRGDSQLSQAESGAVAGMLDPRGHDSFTHANSDTSRPASSLGEAPPRHLLTFDTSPRTSSVTSLGSVGHPDSNRGSFTAAASRARSIVRPASFTSGASVLPRTRHVRFGITEPPSPASDTARTPQCTSRSNSQLHSGDLSPALSLPADPSKHPKGLSPRIVEACRAWRSAVSEGTSGVAAASPLATFQQQAEMELAARRASSYDDASAVARTYVQQRRMAQETATLNAQRQSLELKVTQQLTADFKAGNISNQSYTSSRFSDAADSLPSARRKSFQEISAAAAQHSHSLSRAASEATLPTLQADSSSRAMPSSPTMHANSGRISPSPLSKGGSTSFQSPFAASRHIFQRARPFASPVDASSSGEGSVGSPHAQVSPVSSNSGSPHRMPAGMLAVLGGPREVRRDRSKGNLRSNLR